MNTRRELSPRDRFLGASTDEAQRIAQLSKQIVSSIVADDSAEGKIKQRVVMASGNPGFVQLIRFCHNPIRAGITAIKEGRNIYTDVNMVRVGISKDIAHFGGKVICELADSDSATDQELTRASTGLLKLGSRLNDSIVAIGNAPSAAITAVNVIRAGIRPRLIVATPVGFVNAAESKELIRSLDVPSITTVGTQGGTPVAVAIVNELISMASR